MMRTLALLFVLTFCPYESFAGTPCPVDITRAQRYSSSQSDIEVQYRNVSDKAIVGIALGVDMYGDDGSMKPLFFELRDREQLAPGENTEGAWAETMYQRDFPRVNVFVKKVRFADNTEWKDDGSGRCNSGLPGIVLKGLPSRVIAPSHPISAGEVATASMKTVQKGK